MSHSSSQSSGSAPEKEPPVGAECAATLKEFIASSLAVFNSSRGGNKDPSKYDSNENYQGTLEVSMLEWGLGETAKHLQGAREDLEDLAQQYVQHHIRCPPLALASGGTAGVVGLKPIGGNGSFASAGSLSFFHIWKSKREARSFHRAFSHLTQAKVEQGLPFPLTVPFFALVLYQGALVTVGLLPPLMSDEKCKVGFGSVKEYMLTLFAEACFSNSSSTTPRFPTYTGGDGREYCLPLPGLVLNAHKLPHNMVKSASTDLRWQALAGPNPVEDMATMITNHGTTSNASAGVEKHTVYMGRVNSAAQKLIHLLKVQHAKNDQNSGAALTSTAQYDGVAIVLHDHGVNMRYLPLLLKRVESFPCTGDAPLPAPTTEAESLDRLTLEPIDANLKKMTIKMLKSEMVGRTLKGLVDKQVNSKFASDLTTAILQPDQSKEQAIEAGVDSFLGFYNDVLKLFMKQNAYFDQTLLPALRLKYDLDEEFVMTRQELALGAVLVVVCERNGVLFNQEKKLVDEVLSARTMSTTMVTLPTAKLTAAELTQVVTGVQNLDEVEMSMRNKKPKREQEIKNEILVRQVRSRRGLFFNVLQREQAGVERLFKMFQAQTKEWSAPGRYKALGLLPAILDLELLTRYNTCPMDYPVKKMRRLTNLVSSTQKSFFKTVPRQFLKLVVGLRGADFHFLVDACRTMCLYFFGREDLEAGLKEEGDRKATIGMSDSPKNLPTFTEPPGNSPQNSHLKNKDSAGDSTSSLAESHRSVRFGDGDSASTSLSPQANSISAYSASGLDGGSPLNISNERAEILMDGTHTVVHEFHFFNLMLDAVVEESKRLMHTQTMLTGSPSQSFDNLGASPQEQMVIEDTFHWIIQQIQERTKKHQGGTGKVMPLLQVGFAKHLVEATLWSSSLLDQDIIGSAIEMLLEILLDPAPRSSSKPIGALAVSLIKLAKPVSAPNDTATIFLATACLFHSLQGHHEHEVIPFFELEHRRLCMSSVEDFMAAISTGEVLDKKFYKKAQFFLGFAAVVQHTIEGGMWGVAFHAYQMVYRWCASNYLAGLHFLTDVGLKVQRVQESANKLQRIAKRPTWDSPLSIFGRERGGRTCIDAYEHILSRGCFYEYCKMHYCEVFRSEREEFLAITSMTPGQCPLSDFDFPEGCLTTNGAPLGQGAVYNVTRALLADRYIATVWKSGQAGIQCQAAIFRLALFCNPDPDTMTNTVTSLKGLQAKAEALEAKEYSFPKETELALEDHLSFIAECRQVDSLSTLMSLLAAEGKGPVDKMIESHVQYMSQVSDVEVENCARRFLGLVRLTPEQLQRIHADCDRAEKAMRDPSARLVRLICMYQLTLTVNLSLATQLSQVEHPLFKSRFQQLQHHHSEAERAVVDPDLEANIFELAADPNLVDQLREARDNVEPHVQRAVEVFEAHRKLEASFLFERQEKQFAHQREELQHHEHQERSSAGEVESAEWSDLCIDIKQQISDQVARDEERAREQERQVAEDAETDTRAAVEKDSNESWQVIQVAIADSIAEMDPALLHPRQRARMEKEEDRGRQAIGRDIPWTPLLEALEEVQRCGCEADDSQSRGLIAGAMELERRQQLLFHDQRRELQLEESQQRQSVTEELIQQWKDRMAEIDKQLEKEFAINALSLLHLHRKRLIKGEQKDRASIETESVSATVDIFEQQTHEQELLYYSASYLEMMAMAMLDEPFARARLVLEEGAEAKQRVQIASACFAEYRSFLEGAQERPHRAAQVQWEEQEWKAISHRVLQWRRRWDVTSDEPMEVREELWRHDLVESEAQCFLDIAAEALEEEVMHCYWGHYLAWRSTTAIVCRAEQDVRADVEYEYTKRLKDRLLNRLLGPAGGHLRETSALYALADVKTRRAQDSLNRKRLQQGVQAGKLPPIAHPSSSPGRQQSPHQRSTTPRRYEQRPQHAKPKDGTKLPPIRRGGYVGQTASSRSKTVPLRYF